MMRPGSLYALLFTIFNDALGWSVVLTIFAPLLMQSDCLLSSETPLQTQNLILGFLIAAYPFTQFLCMPFLGAISDFMGRKKILEWTILFGAFTFLLSGFAIWIGSLSLLFISRILAGVFSANGSIASAAIADMSSLKDKAKNLSLSGIVGGLAWVVGPLLGGVLATEDFFLIGSFETPFVFVSLLFFFNYFWMKYSFKETYVKKGELHNWKQEIQDVTKLTQIPEMAPWLVISFLFYLGWGFYVLFYPALLVQRFAFDPSSIGLLSGYLSIFWMLGAFALRRGYLGQWMTQRFLLCGFFVTGVLIFLLSFSKDIRIWYFGFPIVGFFGSMIWTRILAFLSNLAGKENQGKVFGVSSSLMSLAMCLSPAIAGALANLGEQMPMAFSGVCLAVLAAFASVYHFGFFVRHTRKTEE